MAANRSGRVLLEEKIIFAIEQIRSTKKRPDKVAISYYLMKKFDLERDEVEEVVDDMLEEGILYSKDYSDGRVSLFITENIISGEGVADKFNNSELNNSTMFSTLRSSQIEGEISVGGEIENENTRESLTPNHLNVLSNLILEKERAYNILFEMYKEERLTNIQTMKENKQLSLKLSLELSFKLPRKNDHVDTAIQTETPSTMPANIFLQNSQNENISLTTTNACEPAETHSDHLRAELENVRIQKHSELLQLTNNEPIEPIENDTPVTPVSSPICLTINTPSTTFFEFKKPERNAAHEWRDGVVLVTGDSMIGGLEG